MAGTTVLIDGSHHEGGGQILRNAAALSCILDIPITVNKIRAGRSNPGLRPQHLSGLMLLRDLCGGDLQGGSVGSTEITLHPKSIKGGTFLADTKTAGSICLLMQAALPCLLFANTPSELTLRGGTDADMAPPIDYFTWVLHPIAAQFGVNFECDIRRRGFYPKGGGEAVVKAQPIASLKPVKQVDFGQLTRISGRAFVAGVLPVKIAHTMVRVAQNILGHQYRNVPVEIEAVKEPDHLAFGNGTGIFIMAETSTGCRLAGSALGKRGVPAEKVAQEAADSLLEDLGYQACVDRHLQDQLVILMALAPGRSTVKCGPVTPHTQTAIHIAQTLTKAKFEIQKVEADNNLIICDGIGLENTQL